VWGESHAPLAGARYDTDMRSRVPLFALLLVVSSFALPLAAHAVIPFFGPIVPEAVNRCAAGWGAVIDVINRIIEFLITIAIVFVAPLMIAYSGFLFVVNPVNASGKEQAKKILLNTVVGIVIALAGWLIVDAIMAVLYKPDTPIAGGTLGVWSQLITSGGQPFCLIQEAALKNLDQTNLGVTGVTAQGGVTTTAGPGQLKNGFALGCTASNDLNANDLAGAGVTGRSTANCCTKTQSTCTSLDGMLQNTIDQIKNVQNKCGGVTVTGGTEVGHASEGGTGSHSSGSKVDLGQNLISCITGTAGSSSVNPPSFGSSQVKDKCGNIYTWEGNHTDIYVQSACVF
jgi:hypothetical protein